VSSRYYSITISFILIKPPTFAILVITFAPCQHISTGPSALIPCLASFSLVNNMLWWYHQ